MRCEDSVWSGRLASAAACVCLFGSMAVYGIEGVAYYDPPTGNVTVDVSMSDENLTSLALQWRDFGNPRFRADEYIPLPGATDWFAQSDWALYSGGDPDNSAIEPGVYDLGNVLPVQLSEPEAARYFAPWSASLPSNEPFASWTIHGIPEEPNREIHTFRMVYGEGGAAMPSPDNAGDAPPPAINWAESAIVVYDQETGALILDSSEGDFAGFGVSVTHGAYDASQFESVIDGETRLEDRLIQQQGGRSDAVVYSLGDILPDDLRANEFEDLVDGAFIFTEIDLTNASPDDVMNAPRTQVAAEFFFQPASDRPYTRPGDTKDVNDDGEVSPADAMLVVNAIDSDQPWRLDPAASPTTFVDVNADGYLSPLDAVVVINFLNTRGQAALSQTVVPEPGSCGLFIGGFLLIAYRMRRKPFFLTNSRCESRSLPSFDRWAAANRLRN